MEVKLQKQQMAEISTVLFGRINIKKSGHVKIQKSNFYSFPDFDLKIISKFARNVEFVRNISDSLRSDQNRSNSCLQYCTSWIELLMGHCDLNH